MDNGGTILVAIRDETLSLLFTLLILVRQFYACYLNSILMLPQLKLGCAIGIANDLVRIGDDVTDVN